MANMASISSMSERASPTVFKGKTSRGLLLTLYVSPKQDISLICLYLVDDVDGTLQHESCSLPLVIDPAVLSQLLDFVLSCLAKQHLETPQSSTTESFSFQTF